MYICIEREIHIYIYIYRYMYRYIYIYIHTHVVSSFVILYIYIYTHIYSCTYFVAAMLPRARRELLAALLAGEDLARRRLAAGIS